MIVNANENGNVNENSPLSAMHGFRFMKHMNLPRADYGMSERVLVKQIKMPRVSTMVSGMGPLHVMSHDMCSIVCD